jgi:hypothetical protein
MLVPIPRAEEKTMTSPTNTSIPTWPQETRAIFERAATVEYASLTRAGEPITVPLTPYLGDDGTTLDVSTGLTYPTKADRARRNPRVALLYADSVGSGLTDPPVVAVQGIATLSDDLQAATDRYVRLSSAKNPKAFQGMPDFLLRRLDWYFARIWMHVTPTRMLWWPHGDLDAAPEEWVNSAADVLPPAPGPVPAPAAPPAASGDWRPVAAKTLERLRHRDLTTVDAGGHPLTVPVAGAALTADGVRLELPAGVAPLVSAGPASLALHDHDDAFTWQHNASLVGTLQLGPEPRLVVHRALETLELPRGRVRQMLAMTTWRRRYAPRLSTAARRLGQPVPVVHPELVARS